MRGIFRFFSVFATLALTTGQLRAAESIDQAVDQIAQRFVSVKAATEAPARVAVTAFVQSDQKANQLTNLVMIALTGKMVELGTGVFRVIERAQLENALNEIQLSEVDLFNPESAKKFGNFLGVDALIVGEVTTLFDRVRIDSRLIDVETIETIQQASVWIPLTPTVQKQLETPVRLRRLNVGGEDDIDLRNGIWTGTGQCGESLFGVAISVVVDPANDKLVAMQTYFPTLNGPKLEAGALSMEGTIDPNTNEFTLTPSEWLYQPAGHSGLGFSGSFDLDREEIHASYNQEGCGQLLFRRN